MPTNVKKYHDMMQHIVLCPKYDAKIGIYTNTINGCSIQFQFQKLILSIASLAHYSEIDDMATPNFV